MLTSNLLPSSAQDQVLLDLDDGALEKKVCTGPCGRGLPLSAFKKHKTGKYGRYSWCRECCSKKGKDQRKANPLTEEERKVSRERSKAFRDSHPFSEEERVVERERHRVYYSNSERRLAASKLWKVNHPEQAKATYHAWLKNNPEQAKASSKRWRENNPERVRELYTNWVSSNRERVRALKRKWHTEHPEARLRRYAIVQDSDFTFDQWLEILNEFGF